MHNGEPISSQISVSSDGAGTLKPNNCNASLRFNNPGSIDFSTQPLPQLNFSGPITCLSAETMALPSPSLVKLEETKLDDNPDFGYAISPGCSSDLFDPSFFNFFDPIESFDNDPLVLSDRSGFQTAAVHYDIETVEPISPLHQMRYSPPRHPTPDSGVRSFRFGGCLDNGRWRGYRDLLETGQREPDIPVSRYESPLANVIVWPSSQSEGEDPYPASSSQFPASRAASMAHSAERKGTLPKYLQMTLHC